MHTYRIHYYVIHPCPDGQQTTCYITVHVVAPTLEAAQAQARAAETQPIFITGIYQES